MSLQSLFKAKLYTRLTANKLNYRLRRLYRLRTIYCRVCEVSMAFSSGSRGGGKGATPTPQLVKIDQKTWPPNAAPCISWLLASPSPKFLGPLLGLCSKAPRRNKKDERDVWKFMTRVFSVLCCVKRLDQNYFQTIFIVFAQLTLSGCQVPIFSYFFLFFWTFLFFSYFPEKFLFFPIFLDFDKF